MSHPAHQPFPESRHRVRTIALQVEALEDGRLRMSSPHARGWAATAANPLQLARALSQAFTEVTVASYARQHGRSYDLDAMTTHVPGDPLADAPQQRVRGGSPRRRPAHDPAAWSRDEDGRWRSPGGRAYKEDSRVVQNVLSRRRSLGLPTD